MIRLLHSACSSQDVLPKTLFFYKDSQEGHDKAKKNVVTEADALWPSELRSLSNNWLLPWSLSGDDLPLFFWRRRPTFLGYLDHFIAIVWPGVSCEAFHANRDKSQGRPWVLKLRSKLMPLRPLYDLRECPLRSKTGRTLRISRQLEDYFEWHPNRRREKCENKEGNTKERLRQKRKRMKDKDRKKKIIKVKSKKREQGN